MSVEPDHQMDIILELKHSCILYVPIHLFQNDFTFLVNGNKFKTYQLISDLLSPLICHIHTNDPIFDTFTIKIPEKEARFILEVIKILKNNSIIHIEGNKMFSNFRNVVFNFIYQFDQ